ncbi:MAG: hypothetical protein ACI865_000374 [Flavobacteriaceae bacterium]|jgi:hypothetical protein
MKAIYLIFVILLLSPFGFSQEEVEIETEEAQEEMEAAEMEIEAAEAEIEAALQEMERALKEIEGLTDPDTTRMTIGNTTFIIIENGEDGDNPEDDEWSDDMDPEERDNYKSKRSEPHWAGLDLGVMMLMDQNQQNNFVDNPYWDNDIAKSLVFNVNIIEKKFNFGTPFVGLTTGLGFNFNSIAFRDNYLLTATPDSVYGVIDTVNIYSKNKLRAAYLTVPLMLEFNTSRNESKSVYLAAGVVGGVRIASKLKKRGEFDGKEFKQKEKGTYGLNSFKLDAAVRLGFGDVGIFANYSLLPLFDTEKTIEVYPLTFGLSMNF